MMIELLKENVELGVISDTHGLLRPEVLTVFDGVDYIVHAGDIGDKSVLEQLEKTAPVLSVLGNTDNPLKFMELYDTAILKTAHVFLYIIHNINNLDLDPGSAGFDAVIYGHSHTSIIETRNGVLYFNPASAGPRRFSLPVSVGKLSVTGEKIEARIINLC